LLLPRSWVTLTSALTSAPEGSRVPMGARRAVPAAKASGRYRFGEGTFPRIPGNDGEAPKDLYGACWCQVVFFSVSPDRSRVAGRSPEAPRDRGRRSPGVCRPISILRGCPASCRARPGIGPAERSAPPPLLPNALGVAGDAAPARRAVGGSAGAAWHGVAPAARPRSVVPRGCDVWEY